MTHPAPGHRGPTLAQALAGVAAGGEHPERAGIVHRLDRDTSGLLVVARSDEAHAALARMMKAREITREYLALVEGHPDAESGTIDAPIGRDRGNRTVMSTRTDRAREAVTHFELLERLPRTALLRVRLETGPHPPDPRAPRGDRPSRWSATRSTGAATAVGASGWRVSFFTLRR